MWIFKSIWAIYSFNFFILFNFVNAIVSQLPDTIFFDSNKQNYFIFFSHFPPTYNKFNYFVVSQSAWCIWRLNKHVGYFIPLIFTGMQHPQLQILFDLDTESKFCFVAICIEHQRVSKDSLSLLCPQFSSCAFVLEREVAFSAENITPVKITRGKRGAQRARNSLCTRKCIKGENVIYRVHAQNSREWWSCVREWRRGRW